VGVLAFTFVGKVGIELDLPRTFLETPSLASCVVVKHLLPLREVFVMHSVVVGFPVGLPQVCALQDALAQVEVFDFHLQVGDTLAAHLLSDDKIRHLVDPRVLLDVVVNLPCGVDHLHEVEFVLKHVAVHKL